MSARTTLLVIEREVREAARRKGIWALVVLVFLGSTAVVLLPGLLPDDHSSSVVIVGDDTFGLEAALADIADRDIEVTFDPDRERASLAVEAGDVDLAIVMTQPPVLLVENESSTLVAIVREVVANRVAASRLAELGIDPSAVVGAFVSATPDVQPVDVERSGREAAAFVLTLVLYLLTVILTSQVASGIAVEKSNRVSEVLLAIVPPRSMLFGKVLGVGSIGLVTLLAGAIPVVVRFALGGDLPEDLGWTLAVSSAWFVGGLALYLTIAGALGALVSRQEEAGAVVTPLTMVVVVGYIVSISAADTRVGAILAYVPLLSPMLEPYRIAIGAGSAVEYVTSLALLIGAVLLVGRIGAVIFRRAIVRTGRRLKLREVLGPRRN